MRIELLTQAAALALAEYLERCECTVTVVNDSTLEVAPPPRAQSAREREIEIQAYLHVWLAMNPKHAAELLPPF